MLSLKVCITQGSSSKDSRCRFNLGFSVNKGRSSIFSYAHSGTHLSHVNPIHALGASIFTIWRPPTLLDHEHNVIQSTLGFETLDKAAALGLATATPLMDLRQYINSNLGFSNLKIWLLYSKIAAVVVAKPSGHKNKNGNNSEAKKWLNNMYFLKTLLVIKISYSSSTIE